MARDNFFHRFTVHSVDYLVITLLFNCNFSKEQYMLSEDDRMIEISRSVLNVLM